MTKKEFALEQIKEYIQDSSKCGYDEKKANCMNITDDGKMCIAGKNYLPSIRIAHRFKSVMGILRIYNGDQSKVFIPSSVDILTTLEWAWLQNIHDKIAGNELSLSNFPIHHSLFTYEELMALKN